MIDLRERDRRPELARQRAEQVRLQLSAFTAGVFAGMLAGVMFGVLLVRWFGR